MNLIIGTTTIEITSCIRMRDLQRGFYLNIEIPKENITFEELTTLFDGCVESIIINDEKEGETVYNGFSLMNSVMLKDGIYHVEQCCVSEIEAQLSLAQSKIAKQEEIINNQAIVINNLNEELLNTQLALCELYENTTSEVK